MVFLICVPTAKVKHDAAHLATPYRNNPLSLHRAFCSLFNQYTKQMHIYSFNDPKIHIKTLKTLLHVSVIRSSPGSIHCSLLKL